MKAAHGWFWPDGEEHMLAWIINPKNRMILNGRLSYQGKKQQAALDLCSRFRVAVDIGSHVGLWTYNLAHHFQTVRCFEPVQAHRDCFALNVVASNVILYPLALGLERTSVSIKTNPVSSGDSWVDGPGAVQMAPLDDFAFTDVDFLKVDAEGFEELILRGGRQTIIRNQPVICVEQKRDMSRKFGLEPRGALRFLEGLGYEIKTEIAGDFLMAPRKMPPLPNA